MSNLKVLKLLVLRNAAFFGEALPDAVVAMHAEALEDLDPQKVDWAYKQLIRTSKTRRMPLPGDVRALVCPEGNDAVMDDARDASSRIIAAISKYGHTNTDRAREYIGPLGWEVVQRQGGWLTVCQMSDDQLATFQAQWRELAAVLRRKFERGLLSMAPGLGIPHADNVKKISQMANSAVKGIAEINEEK